MTTKFETKLASVIGWLFGAGVVGLCCTGLVWLVLNFSTAALMLKFFGALAGFMGVVVIGAMSVKRDPKTLKDKALRWAVFLTRTVVLSSLVILLGASGQLSYEEGNFFGFAANICGLLIVIPIFGGLFFLGSGSEK